MIECYDQLPAGRNTRVVGRMVFISSAVVFTNKATLEPESTDSTATVDGFKEMAVDG